MAATKKAGPELPADEVVCAVLEWMAEWEGSSSWRNPPRGWASESSLRKLYGSWQRTRVQLRRLSDAGLVEAELSAYGERGWRLTRAGTALAKSGYVPCGRCQAPAVELLLVSLCASCKIEKLKRQADECDASARKHAAWALRDREGIESQIEMLEMVHGA